MNRFLLFLALLATALFFLDGCAGDDDTLGGRTDPAAEGAPPVPGAETPAPNANGAGWF